MKKTKKIRKVTLLRKIKYHKSSHIQNRDRSYTTNIAYINKNNDVVYRDKFLDEDIILNSEDFEITPAYNFYADNKQAIDLVKNNYNGIKYKKIRISPNKNTGDMSYTDKDIVLIAENETHFQTIIPNPHFLDPYFEIFRKDETNFVITGEV